MNENIFIMCGILTAAIGTLIILFFGVLFALYLIERIFSYSKTYQILMEYVWNRKEFKKYMDSKQVKL